jgi:hypothetical protein
MVIDRRSSDELELAIQTESAKLSEGGQDVAPTSRQEEEEDHSMLTGVPYADPDEEPLPYTGEHGGKNTALVASMEMSEKYNHHPSIQQVIDDISADRIVITPEDIEGAREQGLSVQEAVYFRVLNNPRYININNEERGEILRCKDKNQKLSNDWLAELYPQYFSSKELREMESRKISKRPGKLDRFKKAQDDLKETLKQEVEAEGMEWNEDLWENYRIQAINDRIAEEDQKAVKLLGQDTVDLIKSWSLEHLPDYNLNQMSTFQIGRLLLENDPNRLSDAQLKRFYDKYGEPRKEILSAWDSPLRRPDGQYFNETGNLRETPKKKKSGAATPKLPSEDELKKMSSEEIAKYLPFTKNPEW